MAELIKGTIITGPPKPASGIRWISIPPFLLPDVAEHLDQFTGTGGDQLVFTSPKGARRRRRRHSVFWAQPDPCPDPQNP